MNTVKWCQKLFTHLFSSTSNQLFICREDKKTYLSSQLILFLEIQNFHSANLFQLHLSVCLNEGCPTNCIWPGMFIPLAFIWFRSWALENQFDPSCFLSASESMILTLAPMAAEYRSDMINITWKTSGYGYS